MRYLWLVSGLMISLSIAFGPQSHPNRAAQTDQGCPNALAPHLKVGDYAQVSPNPPTPLRVRVGPGHYLVSACRESRQFKRAFVS